MLFFDISSTSFPSFQSSMVANAEYYMQGSTDLKEFHREFVAGPVPKRQSSFSHPLS